MFSISKFELPKFELPKFELSKFELPQDARLYQIASLSLFLLVGFATRDWTLHPEVVASAIATCLLTQYLFLKYLFLKVPLPKGDLGGSRSEITIESFYSPMITSLGLSILLRVDHWWIMVFAAVMAIASKFIIQFNHKHVFNPANFGIVAALVLTREAWVSPGQWGESAWYGVMFLVCGGLVLRKVGRFDTTIAFLGFYVGLELLRNLYLGWTWDVWAHRMMSGSLVMFSLFMITDPRTIPDTRLGRGIWVFSIAFLTFILRNFFFLNTAVFFALFAIAPMAVVCDRVFKGDRFVWAADAGG
jgi:Na+-transporting NADH:ubiquinone oxidoreductase subunit NqrB